MKRKHYVVFIGSKRGIFKTWVEAKAATDHFSRPVHKVYGSWDEALAAWRLYTQKGVLPYKR